MIDTMYEHILTYYVGFKAWDTRFIESYCYKPRLKYKKILKIIYNMMILT